MKRVVVKLLGKRRWTGHTIQSNGKRQKCPCPVQKRIEGHGVIITQSFSSPDIFIVY